MKDLKSKSNPSKKLRTQTSSPSKTFHSRIEYGMMYRGNVVGGIKNPELFGLEGVKAYPNPPYKPVKIRVTYEVISEVIL
jgi:hypothetical protein